MATLPPTFSLEPQYKEQFAKFLMQGFSAFVAAMKMWPNDVGLASMVAAQWPTDPYVEAFIEKMKEDAAKKDKPSGKAEQVKRIEDRMPRMADDNYLRAERLVAEMLGHIEKAAPPSVVVDNRQQTIERVMVVRDHGSDDAWEAKLRDNQKRLIEANE